MIPREYREDLLGDLQEEYLADVLPRLGEGPAKRWFKREFLRCLRSNLRVRLGTFFRRIQVPPPSRRSSSPPSGLMDSILQDIRFAIRSLSRSRSFAVVAVLTLALGIGANTAIFSVLDGVMFKPLPFHEPERLVVPWETLRTREIMTGTVSYPNLEEWEDRNRTFTKIAGMHPEPFTLTGLGLPERVQGVRVTADFFQVLGVGPAQGRLFLPGDDEEGAADVAVVSSGFWSRHFGDSHLRGEESILLNDRPHTIVGVLPGDFDFPFRVAGAEIWTPAALDFVSFYHREWPRLIPVARLREGARLADAQSDMERVARELEEAYPETNTEHGANVVPLMRVIPSRVAGQLMFLMGAVGLVLFVACMNVANLLLARGTDRRRELGLRAALGAGRWRVVRQLVTEGMLLSFLGGALGLGLAWAGTGLLVSLLPADYPRVGDIGVDGRTLAFAAGVSIVTCLLAALFPALQTARADIHASLNEGNRGSSVRRQRRVRQTLVVTEVALAVVVLVGAGLLVRSFQRMHSVDPGFDSEGVLTFRVAKGWSEMQVDDRAEFYSEAVERISALPGVIAAGAGSILPVDGRFRATFQHEGELEVPMGERPLTMYASVTPTFFETLGIPILRGGTFSVRDERDSHGVILVNQAAARKFWPDEDPVGQLIRPDVDITDGDPVLFEVVGIVGDVRDQGLDAEPSPTMYVPHTQQTWPAMVIAARTVVDPSSLIPEIRKVINDLSQEASFSFRRLDEVLARSTEERRFITLVMGLFGVIALALAGVGVFGVLSYSVTLRTRELGLRRALGADVFSALTLVFRESATLLALGTVLGLGCALFTNRMVSSLLFGVTPTDLFTYFGTCLLLMVSGALASYLPARRATRVDPMVALKIE